MDSSFIESEGLYICKTFKNTKDWLYDTKTEKNQQFRIIHLNIRSLKTHWDQLCIEIQDILQVVDTIILTEINIKDWESPLFNLQGFEKFCSCRSNKKGGGIAIFINSKHKSEFLSKNCEDNNSFEYIRTKVQVNSNYKENMEIISIYRPPNKSKVQFIDDLNDMLEKYTENTCMIVGDTNLNILDENDNVAQQYENVLAIKGFRKLICLNTREEYKSGSIQQSCIDHMYVKTPCEKIQGAIITKKFQIII